MKQKGLFLATGLLFILGVSLAYQQGYWFENMALSADTQWTFLQGGVSVGGGVMSAFGQGFIQFFEGVSALLGHNVLLAIIAIALLAELITLYSSVNIQLKQKKIHLFHKKLVDRFRSGELGMSDSKRELDVLYSVNERIHARGGVLVLFQFIVFLAVILGLGLLTHSPQLMNAANVDIPLFARPASVFLPVLVGLAYLLHSLIKIQVKQREDYISSHQTKAAILFALVGSTVVFFFSSSFAVLLSVYLITQISFSTFRYLIVESKAKAWGKLAQRELIAMLKASKKHKNRVEHLSRKFHHMTFARHLNFHLLEEAASMSFAFVLVLTESGLL